MYFLIFIFEIMKIEKTKVTWKMYKKKCYLHFYEEFSFC